MSQELSLLSLSQAAISNILWGGCVLMDEAILSKYRADSEKKIQKLNLPASISLCLKKGLSLLELSYHNAFEWLKVYGERNPSLRYSKVCIFNGKYRLNRFMIPLGEFNDVKWVIQFVDDPKQNILDRFCFASFYCLEQKVKSLWQDIEKDYYVKDDLLKYCDNYFMGIVRAWINFVDERLFVGHHFRDYLDSSCNLGYEKVITYAWNMIFSSSDHSCLKVTADKGFPKCVHSIYSCLSQEKQLQLLQRNYQILPNVTIWHYYLHPVLVRFIPDQISLHQHSLPEIIYTEFLYCLACKIKETKNNTVYQELFDTVWKIGSVENKSYFLENDQNTFITLCIAGNFNSACCIIKDALLEQKRCFLFKSVEHVLYRNLDISLRYDSMAIRNYLSIFVTDFQRMDAFSDKIPFHASSVILLKEIQLKYKKYLHFVNAVESLISEISSSLNVRSENSCI